MAVYLDELVTKSGMKKENIKILDVAAGTGLVGEELKKRGFNEQNVTALDLCPDMLNVARKKNVYGKLIQAPFGSTMPKGMTARSFDCVIMCGGFAAGHIPLSRLVLDFPFYLSILFSS
jgi:ubiquinone/menaquinone biosynthesis C-methylase UbiE